MHTPFTPRDWSFLAGGPLSPLGDYPGRHLPVGEVICGHLIPPPTPEESAAERRYEAEEIAAIAVFGGG
jgi:hypothetical protein